MKRLVYPVVLLAFIALVSCSDEIKEDDSVDVRFSYTKNMEGVDKFKSEVEKVNVYIFNSSGCFVDEYCLQTADLQNGNTWNLNLDPGVYDFVVWGNLTESYIICPLEKGVTRFDDCHLSLKNNGKQLDCHPTSLFHGVSYKVEINPIRSDKQIIPIHLQKSTKTIRLVAKGYLADNEKDCSYSCKISSVAGKFSFHNSAVAAEKLEYAANMRVSEENELVSEFVLLHAKDHDIKDSRLLFTRNTSDNQEELVLDVLLGELLLPSSVTGDLDVLDDLDIVVLADGVSLLLHP